MQVFAIIKDGKITTGPTLGQLRIYMSKEAAQEALYLLISKDNCKIKELTL